MIEYERTIAANGKQVFRKFQRAGSSDCFRAEAEGLAALAATGTVSTPEVIQVSDQELVTALIPAGAESRPGWRELGRRLAEMHSVQQPCFGFIADNYCGASRQVNLRYSNGFSFFAECRILYQARMARDASLLDAADTRQLEAVAARLEELVPPQAPALLHGDLWRGNVLFDPGGRAHLIDPACYWGWPEAELGMTTLFGSFDDVFYDAYAAHRPLHPGWRERLPLYNLYHLLNHLNLFGSGYYSQFKSALAKVRACGGV
jgi:fructosamine-3-kinase